MALKKFLIRRRPLSGRLEGRIGADPAERQFLHRLFCRNGERRELLSCRSDSVDNLLRLDRGGIELDAERRQCVANGVGDRGWRGDGAALADAFDPERVERDGVCWWTIAISGTSLAVGTR